MTDVELGRERGRLWNGWWAAILVVVVGFVLGLSVSGRHSATFDEGIHLAGGAIHWVWGQPRVHTENGYLMQAWVSLPSVVMGVHLPNPNGRPFLIAAPFNLGEEFLYHDGNDGDRILWWGRAMVGVLTAVTGLVVYGWGRRLFGRTAGMLSVTVFMFTPLVLAHGFLATSDMGVTCFFLLSIAACVVLLERLTWWGILATVGAFTGLFLSKMSAPLLLPAVAVAMGMRVVMGGEWWVGRRWVLRTRERRAMGALVTGVLVSVGVWVSIWGTYGFTYSAFRGEQVSAPGATVQFWPEAGWDWALHESDTALKVVAVARKYHVLPEAYLYGYAYVEETSHYHQTFAAGTYTTDGWWWFYFYVFGVTTPLAVMAFMVLPVGLLRERVRAGMPGKWRSREGLMFAVITGVFVLVYWAVAVLSYRGSGPRHLLPLYPMTCIAIGSGVWILREKGGRLMIGGLVAWLMVESLWVRPDYLSYFNETVGGSSNGYRCLVDSSLDWGQDLPALAETIAKVRQPKEQVYLSYFGTADPGAYGIEAFPLPSFIPLPATREELMTPLHAGLYCVSATRLQNVFGPNPGLYVRDEEDHVLLDWRHAEALLQNAVMKNGIESLSASNRDYLRDVPESIRNLETKRLMWYLRTREPDARAAKSILVYRLSEEELNLALGRE